MRCGQQDQLREVGRGICSTPMNKWRKHIAVLRLSQTHKHTQPPRVQGLVSGLSESDSEFKNWVSVRTRVGLSVSARAGLREGECELKGWVE